jgi:hypothetical protein
MTMKPQHVNNKNVILSFICAVTRAGLARRVTEQNSEGRDNF